MIEFKKGSGIYLCEGAQEFKKYAKGVCKMIEIASKEKNTALAIRSEDYIAEKIASGKAVIAVHGEEVIGFCYIETWEHEKFVANSGLIVAKDYRKTGLANKIKEMAFNLSERKFPTAKIFGLTTSLAVMKINSGLGYQPVTFSELTNDENFWKGCETCKYFDILTRTSRVHCLCTAMVYDPAKKNKINGSKSILKEELKKGYEEKSTIGF